MNSLLYTLYDALGLELIAVEGESPTLTIDDDMVVYFDENNQGLKMICPVGPLPDQVEQLQSMLRWNYENQIILAASEAGHDMVLAQCLVVRDSTEESLIEALENLIESVHTLRIDFYR